MAKEFTITREVTQKECSWLNRTFTKGELVYYTPDTYGCATPEGTMITEYPEEGCGYEIPNDALEPTGKDIANTRDVITDEEHIHKACKPGKGSECCRYLMASSKGMECGKNDPDTKSMFDSKVDEMNAKGDNCDGWEFKI